MGCSLGLAVQARPEVDHCGMPETVLCGFAARRSTALLIHILNALNVARTCQTREIWRSSAVVDVITSSTISQHSHAIHVCSECNEEGRSGRVVGMLDKPPVIISLVVKVPYTRHSGLECMTLFHETTKLSLHSRGCTPLSIGSL